MDSFRRWLNTLLLLAIAVFSGLNIRWHVLHSSSLMNTQASIDAILKVIAPEDADARKLDALIDLVGH